MHAWAVKQTAIAHDSIVRDLYLLLNACPAADSRLIYATFQESFFFHSKVISIFFFKYEKPVVRGVLQGLLTQTTIQLLLPRRTLLLLH